MQSTWTTTSPADYAHIARELLRQQPNVLAFTGPLGAGKTTLAQALARELKITTPITSPTFTLQHVYPVPQPAAYQIFVHLDCYRIKDLRELPMLDLEHWCSNPKNLVVIEWANRIRAALEPFNPTWVNLQSKKDGRRIVASL